MSLPLAKGLTKAERYLKRLCDRSFLSLWSYSGVYRDQHWGNARNSEGKELCDTLVVFENHIIIFSDKNCRFGSGGDLQTQWSRWFRKAVQKSADQVFGAERWIKEQPHRLFLDRSCRVRFPIPLPEPQKMVFHRVVVAHDASRACAEHLGGSGSLMIRSDVTADAHLAEPFTIGNVDPRGYVHVFDDTTIDIVLRTLDTITDFVRYLQKKEGLLSTRKLSVAGEEELLALYLKRMNSRGERDFEFPTNYDAIALVEGPWDEFVQHPQRIAQVQADQISYLWDDLIEKFTFHLVGGTQYFATGGIADTEFILRFMAREPRTRRRLLAQSLAEMLQRTPADHRAARIMGPSTPGDPYYLFLLFPRSSTASDEEYRIARRVLLSHYCAVLKLEHPEALDIIGIATESGDVNSRSEDALYLDARRWTKAEAEEARAVQREFGLLKRTKSFAATEHEYPTVRAGKILATTNYSRNSPCICGSGKRFKRCCGKGK